MKNYSQQINFSGGTWYKINRSSPKLSVSLASQTAFPFYVVAEKVWRPRIIIGSEYDALRVKPVTMTTRVGNN